MTQTRYEVLVIGGGPTGIGAALALQDAKASYLLVDSNDQFGGLASSVVDDRGFTWDMGGHVQFSHYSIFDHVMDRALGHDGWLEHARKSAMQIGAHLVPYPAQDHLHFLPEAVHRACLAGMEAVSQLPLQTQNFEAWLMSAFGDEICRLFMRPYNEKVWATPLDRMSCQWMGERVSRPDVRELRRRSETREIIAWGPNSTFRFPARGGTGAIWNGLGQGLRSAALGTRIVAMDPKNRVAHTAQGDSIPYEYAISTMPLDRLAQVSGLPSLAPASRLRHVSTHVIGFGLAGEPPANLADMSWLYFADHGIPFYRATIFSNYSPHHTPAGRNWSLMCEVAESNHRPLPEQGVLNAAEAALTLVGISLPENPVLSRWHRRLEYGYPVPTLERDRLLEVTLPQAERAGIYSRGRFGAWKYEVSNQDHSFMQGWECAHRLMEGAGPEAEPTLHLPDLVNHGHFKAPI